MKELENISEKLTNWIGTPLSIVVHTVFFVGIFVLKIFGVKIDDILLVLTTVVSLEAIYLSIFIQMSVNKTSKRLRGVEKDIDEIQEDVEDLSEDEDDDEMIQTIKDIQNKLNTLHKEVIVNRKS